MTTKTFGVAQDPVMGGFEFRQEQLNHPRFANIPVIVVSAAADPQATASARGRPPTKASGRWSAPGTGKAVLPEKTAQAVGRRRAFKHQKCFRLAVTRTLSPKQDSTRRWPCGSTAIIGGL